MLYFCDFAVFSRYKDAEVGSDKSNTYTQNFQEIVEQSDTIGSTQKYLINEAIKPNSIFLKLMKSLEGSNSGQERSYIGLEGIKNGLERSYSGLEGATKAKREATVVFREATERSFLVLREATLVRVFWGEATVV